MSDWKVNLPKPNPGFEKAFVGFGFKLSGASGSGRAEFSGEISETLALQIMRMLVEGSAVEIGK